MGGDMTQAEEQIVEQLAREVSDNLCSDAVDNFDRELARAILKLLGPAPLKWREVETWGAMGLCCSVHQGESYHALIRDGNAWSYRGVAYEAPTLDESLAAAKAAAEARHWREHFAGTLLGQEGRDG